MAPPMRKAQPAVKHPTCVDIWRLQAKAHKGVRRFGGVSDMGAQQSYLRRVHVKFYALLKAEGFYVEGA